MSPALAAWLTSAFALDVYRMGEEHCALRSTVGGWQTHWPFAWSLERMPTVAEALARLSIDWTEG